MATVYEKKDALEGDRVELVPDQKLKIETETQKPCQAKDIEHGQVKGFEYTYETLRLALLRKVYGLIVVEVITTLVMSFLATYNDGFKQMLLKNPKMVLSFEFTAVLLTIILAVFKNLRRKHPVNLFCLGFITVGFANAVAFICAYVEQEKVFITVVITSVMLVAITSFTLQTRFNFFSLAPFIFAGSVMLLIVYIQLITDHYYNEELTPQNEQMFKLTVNFGILLFTAALIFHTQVLLGPKAKLNFIAEEHIFIALTLYTDFVNLFLKVLFIV